MCTSTAPAQSLEKFEQITKLDFFIKTQEKKLKRSMTPSRSNMPDIVPRIRIIPPIQCPGYLIAYAFERPSGLFGDPLRGFVGGVKHLNALAVFEAYFDLFGCIGMFHQVHFF